MQAISSIQPPRLLALDLDGTLLDENRLPMGHALAVARIARLGVRIALVTGRSPLTTRWVWHHLRLTTPLVCFNGGWVGLPHGRTLLDDVLSEADVHLLLDHIAPDEGTLCLYPSADSWVVDRESAGAQRWRDKYGIVIDVVPQLRRTWRGPSHKLMLVTDAQRLPAIQRRLRDALGERFHIVASCSDLLEISLRGVTKASGLQCLAAHLGIAREAVWAVGDADNDREMIAWAGRGFAMGHAPESLRDTAPNILPSIHARGLCALVPMIERLCAPAGH